MFNRNPQGNGETKSWWTSHHHLSHGLMSPLPSCSQLFPLCVGGPQDHSQAQWFARRTDRTQKSCYIHGIVYYSKGIQMEISPGKRHIGWSPGETRRKLPGVPSWWSCTGHTYFFRVWQHLWIVAAREGLCPGFLLWVSHVGMQHLLDRPWLLRLQPSYLVKLVQPGLRSHVQQNSFQAEYSKGTKVISQEPNKGLSWS